MPKILTAAQVEQDERDGYAFPAPVLTADEVRWMRADLERWEARQGHPLDYPEKSKSYLLYAWADALVHHPKVLDAVEDVIGPDILVYHSTMWIKEPHSAAHVRWHQGRRLLLPRSAGARDGVGGALSEASAQGGAACG
jgi:hypothetical protein